LWARNPRPSKTPQIAQTTMKVVSSANPSNFGKKVTFTARISVASPSDRTPTGTVQFDIDSSNAGSPVNVNEAGAATFCNETMTVGTHAITAIYSGDSNFTSSSGSLLSG